MTGRLRLQVEPGIALAGDLRYLRGEYSFMFVSDDRGLLDERSGEGRTSAVVDYLQLEIGLPRQELLFAWGLHPHTVWRDGTLEPPESSPGLVRVLEPTDLESGTSIEADNRWDWATVWDPTCRWLRVAPGQEDGRSAVEIATGVVLTIDDDELRSIWLHPTVVEA